MHCASCREPLAASDRFCSSCGSVRPPSPSPGRRSGEGPDAPTGAVDASRTITLGESGGLPAPHPSASTAPPLRGRGAFVPGAVLADRYRIVGLLGRGGMGEVYRAEDLRLGETVALKLLPAAQARDPEARARLRDEVRAARRVTHPHVCRVFDFEESAAVPFLSMEYIDGEDLSSLLRRVHHLPPSRAREVAQQIALGLAAIHRQGLLHRDLKPANVMLDGRGDARITDLGLAEVAGAGEGGLAGTPAYMAPELLAGRPATVASDIFALGMVLYEVFSGERAFPGEAPTLGLLREDRERHTPSRLDDREAGIPAELSDVVHRCLERRPEDRPQRVEEVLTALGIGDPVAAALAAGKTPSPEMLARAGPEGTLSSGWAALLLGLLLVGLGAVLAFADRATLTGVVSPELSPELLRHRGQVFLDELSGVSDSRYSLLTVAGYGRIGLPAGHPVGEPLTLRDLRDATRGPVTPLFLALWVSPFPIDVDLALNGAHSDVASSGVVVVDIHGRLRLLAVRLPVAAGAAADASPAGPPFAAALAATGFADYPRRPLELPWVPGVWGEVRQAWEVAHPEGPVRVWLAGTADGRLSYLEMQHELPRGAQIFPWSPEPESRLPPPPGTPQPQPESFAGVVRLLALLGLAVAAAVAWRNRRRERADERGALRFAGLLMAATLIGVPADAVAGFGFTAGHFFDVLGLALVRGLLGWLFYLALEPAIRRRRPRAAIAWSRLLQGRLRDPLVAREVLLGLAVGAPLAGLGLAESWWRWRTGDPVFFFEFLVEPGLSGSPLTVLAAWISALAVVPIAAFVPLLVFVAVRAVLRHELVSEVVALIVGGALLSLATDPRLALGFLLAAAGAFLALRVGLIAALTCLMVRPILLATPFTLDPRSFYFVNTPLVVVVLGGLAVLAWHTVRTPAAATPARA